MSFRRVVIESPFAGDIPRNRLYLKRAILDCIHRNETPYASHLMLTEALNDQDPEERKLGISAGFAWREAADATVVYEDYGRSRGMIMGIEASAFVDAPIEYRMIGLNPDPPPETAESLLREAHDVLHQLFLVTCGKPLHGAQDRAANFCLRLERAGYTHPQD